MLFTETNSWGPRDNAGINPFMHSWRDTTIGTWWGLAGGGPSTGLHPWSCMSPWPLQTPHVWVSSIKKCITALLHHTLEPPGCQRTGGKMTKYWSLQTVSRNNPIYLSGYKSSSHMKTWDRSPVQGKAITLKCRVLLYNKDKRSGVCMDITPPGKRHCS